MHHVLLMLPLLHAGISLMDAGSMAVFSFACLVLYKLAAKFAKAVDKATMEVADYTVLIKGLPETTPIDVRVVLGLRRCTHNWRESCCQRLQRSLLDMQAALSASSAAAAVKPHCQPCVNLTTSF